MGCVNETVPDEAASDICSPATPLKSSGDAVGALLGGCREPRYLSGSSCRGWKIHRSQIYVTKALLGINITEMRISCRQPAVFSWLPATRWGCGLGGRGLGGGGGRGPVKPIISLTHWWDYSELVREGKRDQKRATLIEVLCFVVCFVVSRGRRNGPRTPALAQRRRR